MIQNWQKCTIVPNMVNPHDLLMSFRFYDTRAYIAHLMLSYLPWVSGSNCLGECNLNPLFVSLLKHVGMRRLLEINDDRKQYHHFPPLVHISLCSPDILKIFFAHDISLLLLLAEYLRFLGCFVENIKEHG